MGSLAEEAVYGKLTLGRAAKRMFSAFNDAFNPMGGGSFLQFLSPTAGDPFVQIAENKNFFGGPIAKEQPAYQPKVPDSQLYFKRVNVYTRALTDWLNRITGGTEKVSGLIDVNPETLDHFIEWAGGGVGRFLSNSLNLGVTLFKDGDVPPTEKLPILRQFLKTPSEYTDTGTIREMLDESARTIFNERDKARFEDALRRATDAGIVSAEQESDYRTKYSRNQADAIASVEGAKSRESILAEYEQLFSVSPGERPAGQEAAIQKEISAYNQRAKNTGQTPITPQARSAARKRGREALNQRKAR